jgi:hypothetical protein
VISCQLKDKRLTFRGGPFFVEGVLLGNLLKILAVDQLTTDN